MFWADRAAEEIKKASGSKPQLVDDAKTPSGKVHVGALRGVIIHDLVHKSLIDQGVKSRYTYIFDDFDPMDDLPAYLPKEKYEKYIGVPLKDIPAPEGKESYAKYYAEDFKNVFSRLGAKPEILWTSELYKSKKLDESIKKVLDNAEKIQEIYYSVSGSKKEKNWLPFHPVCPKCGKIGTTKATNWDGKEVEFTCEPEMVVWAKGCGYKGSVSPFGGTGKMPWKVEWAAKWHSLGVTFEGAGKDHSSRGGSRDLANTIARRVFGIEPPHDLPYEFFLFGGGKMSSSKGIGASAQEVGDSLPPSLLRFLVARVQAKVAIDFDPSSPNTVPSLYDEYDRGQKAFFEKGDPDLSRTWEASQVENKENHFVLRFSQVVSLIQMPGVDLEKEAETTKESKLTEEDKEALKERIKYAKIWLEKFAPDSVKFKISEKLPAEAEKLSSNQTKFLDSLAGLLGKTSDPEKLQNEIYQLGKENDLSSKETFGAIYISLLGKESGPKAAWLILSLDKEFVAKRFKEVTK